jgi:chromosome segregation ATPase
MEKKMWILAIRNFLRLNWKWILLAALMGFVYLKATSAWKDYKAAVQAQAREIKTLALEKQAAEMERERAQNAIAQLQFSRQMLATMLQEAQEEREALRKETQERLDAFTRADGTKHDLAKAANRHGQWVGKLATEASNEVIEEIENEINH